LDIIDQTDGVSIAWRVDSGETPISSQLNIIYGEALSFQSIPN
jgi:hypothetical protein